MTNILRFLFLMTLLIAPALATAQTPPMLDASQLDQITASIALYPDQMLNEILVASTYPDQVDLAAGWLDDPLNAGLQGDALRDALQGQPWDNSVKTLVFTPRLLFMLSDNDEWMRELGNAFATQSADVMDSVQRLRWQAYRAGTLQSNAEQSVVLQSNYVLIQPAVSAPVPVVVTYWPLPAWDWQHRHMQGHDLDNHEHHEEVVRQPVAAPASQPQIQVQIPKTQPQPQQFPQAQQIQTPPHLEASPEQSEHKDEHPPGTPMIQSAPPTNLLQGGGHIPSQSEPEIPREQGIGETVPVQPAPSVREP